MPTNGAILKIEGLKTYFKTKTGYVKAVDGVSLYVPNQMVVGVAGESGSGKSTLINTIFRVLSKNAEIKGGEVLYQDRDILKMDEESFSKKIRWKEISWIPQVSMDVLDPVYKVKDQMVETILAHEDTSKAEALERVYSMIKSVNLRPEVLEKYPHELSGGQKQRVVIAMALLLDPKLVIADEPTTALDVIVQAQIIDIIRKLKKEKNFSMLFVSHDLALLAGLSDYLAIMYAGKIVEFGKVEEIYKAPSHPYTQLLLESIPDIRKRGSKLKSISGSPPDLLNPPSGCRFNPRCPFAMDVCKSVEPEIVNVSPTHYVACHLRK
ncbi:ABC transporter ATP-binding protein [Stygiolobus caldivivus]|uniref:ABC transporter ATP-binding protein n=1 Tax=Stygiolobus caldivivus TaxID=2824673 RepID=UPI001C8414AC|nr:ABC transporter ATP-binding protein [Stygiolobus caldivivus]